MADCLQGTNQVRGNGSSGRADELPEYVAIASNAVIFWFLPFAPYVDIRTQPAFSTSRSLPIVIPKSEIIPFCYESGHGGQFTVALRSSYYNEES